MAKHFRMATMVLFRHIPLKPQATSTLLRKIGSHYNRGAFQRSSRRICMVATDERTLRESRGRHISFWLGKHELQATF